MDLPFFHICINHSTEKRERGEVDKKRERGREREKEREILREKEEEEARENCK
jgi:hypothetical protein